MIHEHSLWKITLLIPLNLKVNIDPLLGAASPRNTRQLIDDAPADFGITHRRAKLLFEKDQGLSPINLGVSFGEVEGEEISEELLYRFFPWTVIVICQNGLPPSPLPGNMNGRSVTQYSSITDEPAPAINQFQ